MAKYEITHRCGHVETHGITGKVSNRDYLKKKLEEDLCSKCQELQPQSYVEEQRKIAKEKIEKGDVPTLKGTEKQVLWAVTIREAIYKNIEESIERGKSKRKPEKYEEVGPFLFSYLNSLEKEGKTKNHATFWIDHFKNNYKSALSPQGTKIFYGEFLQEVLENIYKKENSFEINSDTEYTQKLNEDMMRLEKIFARL